MAFDRNKVLKKAEKLVASGKIPAGIAQYQLLVKDNPRDLGTLNKIGDLYVRISKKVEAIRQFNSIAEIYAEDGFFLKAIAIYKKITKLDPNNVETIRRLATLYSKQGLKTEARAQYQQLVQALLKAGNSQKALGVYESLVELEPENVQHRLALAELKAKLGKPKEAARTFMELGLELDRQGNPKESARAYEMALKTSKGDTQIAEKLVEALTAAGDHDKAALIAEKLLGGAPQSASMLEARALSLLSEGKVDEAEAAARKALDSDPTRAGAVICLSRIQTQRGEFDDAAETISGGLDGVVTENRGEEVVQILEEILSKDPKCRLALEVLYRLQAMLDNTPGIIFAGEKLAEVSAGEGRFSAALAVARRLADLEPNNSAHADRVRRIEAMAEAGEAAEAGEESEPEAIAVEPESDEEIHVIDEPVVASPSAAVPLSDFDGTLPADGAAYVEPELTPEEEEFITERLTEADVFVKYGLSDRAIEQLSAIVEQHPWHILTRQRLRDLHLEEGNRARAAVEAVALGRIYIERGERGQAKAALSEARSIDASCPAIEELETMVTGAQPALTPVPQQELEPVPAPVSAVDAGAADEEILIEEDEEEVHEEVSEEPVIEEAAVPVQPQAQEAGAGAGGDGAGIFDDLESELDAALFAVQDVSDEEQLSELEASPEGHSLDEIVTAFRKGIEKQVDSEDFETHYNLGIAYKEMGLVEEAIAEFQFAAKDEKLMPSCCSMLGVCFKEKGMHSLAVKWYRKGIDALMDGRDDELLNGIRYDLAETLEEMGEFQQAKDLFVEVYGIDSTYRDVADKLKSLEGRLGG